ncbi:MAG TPA: pilus assembly protein TadG-related protein [Symbiobacteriaceae bacterium]|jgi:hypothetical protein
MSRREAGWVTTWLVVFAPALIAFMGLVLDGGVLLVKQQKLDAAADAAALAATDAWDREYWKWNGAVRIDPGGADGLARQYLTRSLPDARLVEVTVNPANRVNVRTELTVPFFFMRIVGMKERTLESYSTAVRRSVRN